MAGIFSPQSNTDYSINLGYDSTVKLVEPNDSFLPCIDEVIRRTSRIKPHSLGNLNDLKVQQGLIIKDLLFSLLGFEGSYIRYSEKYNPNDIEAKIRGPDFKIAKHLDISLKSIAKKLVKYGKFYCGLKAFLEIYNQPEYGQIVSKLCWFINEFMLKYQEVIVNIESQFKFNSSFNLNIFENIISQEVGNQLVHLYDITIKIHEDSTERSSKLNNNYFQNFVESIQNDLVATGSIDLSTDLNKFNVCKGGLVLNIIQERINAYNGDSLSYNFLNDMFESVSESYVKQLNQWLIKGEIDDPFEEFLIKKNNNLSKNYIIKVNLEKYWDELYMTKADGLITQFQSKEIQAKILSTGKFLNIFKNCTGLDNFDNLNDYLVPISSLNAQDLTLKINNFYDRSNKLITKLLFEGFHFSSLFDTLQWSYLLNNSYNIDTFIDKSFNDLRRNKYSIPTTRVIKNYNEAFQIKGEASSPVKFSINSTNFYDLAKEIISIKSFDAEKAIKSNNSSFKQLLNKSLERYQINSDSVIEGNYDPDQIDEYSIFGVNLDFDLEFPMNLIITENYLFEYQLIFKFQVILKFVDKLLDNSWKEINYSTVWKYEGFDNKIKKWILRCRILHKRMKDFINEFQYYINEEIIDTNFKSMTEQLQKIAANYKSKDFSTQMTEPGNSSIIDNGKFLHKNNAGSVHNNNSLFDEKINLQKQKNHLDNNKLTNDDVDIISLIKSLGNYLNNILNDSLITNYELIESMKDLFDVIIQYNNYLSRLKKSLIMINADLFDNFNQDYPEKFENKAIDNESIQKRFDNLDNLLNSYFEIFNYSITNFIVNLRKFNEIENQLIIVLIERLERCFPDN